MIDAVGYAQALYDLAAERGTEDRVRKEHDHAMDEIRYFAATVAARERHRSVLAFAGAEREAY